MSKLVALSYVLILLGVAFLALAVGQYNQLSITSAQSEISKPLLEAQIAASEAQAQAFGQSAEEIAASSQQARKIVEDSITKINGAFMQTIFVDVALGLISLISGVALFNKER